MNKTYKINHNHHIGTVIFVVEGGNENGGEELRLLKKIFSNLLGFEMHELRRGTDEFIGYQGNPSSKVIGLNLPKNQIHTINDDDLDTLYQRIRDELHLKPENYPLFYIYDRDYRSYRHNQLKRYVKKYTDPYSNEQGDMGQLLLSYPSVEAYMMTCFKDNSYLEKYLLGTEMKHSINTVDYNINNINCEADLIHAVNEMDLALDYFNCQDYDIDSLSDTLLKIYDAQQSFYIDNNSFAVLSEISMALLELGIIIEDDSVQSATIETNSSNISNV